MKIKQLMDQVTENNAVEDEHIKQLLAQHDFNVVEINRKFATVIHINIDTDKNSVVAQDQTRAAGRILRDAGYDYRKYRVFSYMPPIDPNAKQVLGGDWVLPGTRGVRWTGD